jgi:hypothetical protein
MTMPSHPRRPFKAADPMVSGRTAATLRRDMRNWRLKPTTPALLSLFIEPPTIDPRLHPSNPANPAWHDLCFHTRHCADNPPNGTPDPANWTHGIPRPVVEALFALASLETPVPSATLTSTALKNEWLALEPPLDTRIGFCRRCLIEPDPDALAEEIVSEAISTHRGRRPSKAERADGGTYEVTS